MDPAQRKELLKTSHQVAEPHAELPWHTVGKVGCQDTG